MAKLTDDQLDTLRGCFPRGATVYTILRHVSKSGMSRDISVVSILTENGQTIVTHPSYLVARALKMSYNATRIASRDAIRVRGVGMDMGFSVAYDLSMALYGDGYALKHSWL